MKTDPHNQIDELIHSKDSKTKIPMSQEMQKVVSNSKFMQQVKENPIETTKYDKIIFGKVISLNQFLNLRLWPRSFYKTDHLIRLGMGARYEILKRNIPKKRRDAFEFWWLIALIVGAPIVIILLIIFLGGGL